MGQGYSIVGLPDSAIKESLDRTESAIKANGYHMPRTKILVNLSPADIKKTGAAFDLPIAIGLIAASEQLDSFMDLSQVLIMGELGLDGLLYPIKGVLAMAIKAKSEGLSAIILPIQNVQEAGIIEGIPIFGFSHLSEVVQFLNEGRASDANKFEQTQAAEISKLSFHLPKLEDIKGQVHGKRALEIATTLAMEPELMLLDEPTQGMGHEDVQRVTDLIKKVAKGRTILMVEHNMGVVSGICDRISVLQRGAILAEGDYKTVSQNPQVLEAYMGSSASLEGAH